ncbi:hypothetical protein BHE74_00053300 [Ensete ventricosum]|nr:hypothetical protein BHE74_00053300 [Ensete ventricosum]
MVSVWRVDDSGDEALEVKRRRKVQLEGNNNGGKGREEGTKMRAVAVVAACCRAEEEWGLEQVMAVGNAAGSARLGVTGDSWGRKVGKKQGRKKVAAMVTKEQLLKSGSIMQAAMLATGEGGKGDSGNDRSDNSGFWGRTMTDSFTTVLVLPTKVASGRGMVLSMTDGAVEEVLGSTSKGRQQRLRRAEGEVEKIAASVWGVTNSGCGYGCYDPRQAIVRLGRQ